MFLQQAVSLLVASHYKNTPNDLLLLADAPAHQLYVLLAPVDESQVRAAGRGGEHGGEVVTRAREELKRGTWAKEVQRRAWHVMPKPGPWKGREALADPKAAVGLARAGPAQP
jgi:hypothetical protein